MNNLQPRRDPLAANCVTYHAVARYCQRILGVVVEGPFEGERHSAELHCAAYGLTVEQIQHIIWCPIVQAAALCGASRVTTSEFCAVFSSSGAVVTIHNRQIRHAVQDCSEREDRAKNRRFARRAQKAPTWAARNTNKRVRKEPK